MNNVSGRTQLNSRVSSPRGLVVFNRGLPPPSTSSANSAATTTTGATSSNAYYHNYSHRRVEGRCNGNTLLQLGWRILAISLTMLCLVGVTTLLSILYIFVRPFSKPAYRRLACTVCAASFLDAVAILMPNVQLCLTGDSEVPSAIGTSVLVSNHVVEGDWWMVLMLARCVGLRGSVKVFLPNECSIAYCSPGSSAHDLCKDTQSAMGSMPLPSTTASSTLHPSSSSGEPPMSITTTAPAGPLRTWMNFLLRTLLEFPSLSVESGSDYIKERSDLFQLLRSFAEEERSSPVQLLLLPEGWSASSSSTTVPSTDETGGNIRQWSVEEVALRRKLLLAKSLEFAKREGRPQLRHLILPRTTGFNASLESLRASNPVVYDVTIAYVGYDGLVPISIFDLSFSSLWLLTGYRIPKQVHVRIKRYSMEEVVQDANWLDRIWADKDRLLGHFQRHQSFPQDSRGFCKMRVFDTKWHSIENSLIGLARLVWIPFSIPVLILLSIPLGVVVFWLWVWYTIVSLLFPNFFLVEKAANLLNGETNHAEGLSNSEDFGANDRGGESTPFIPATPFASPMVPPSSFSS